MILFLKFGVVRIVTRKRKLISIGNAIRTSLDELGTLDGKGLVDHRYDKFRCIGVFSE